MKPQFARHQGNRKRRNLTLCPVLWNAVLEINYPKGISGSETINAVLKDWNDKMGDNPTQKEVEAGSFVGGVNRERTHVTLDEQVWERTKAIGQPFGISGSEIICQRLHEWLVKNSLNTRKKKSANKAALTA